MHCRNFGIGASWNKSRFGGIKAWMLLLALGLGSGTARADTVITYQGQLSAGGVVVNGNYDFTFSLYDAGTNGNQIGATVTNTGVPVNYGLFTATLDFGAQAFDGEGRWLEIAVRKDTNTFTVLNPRQPITRAPYAISALSITGQTAFTGSFTGDGSGLTNLNLTTITAATNDLSAALSGKIVAATNDLNTALSSRITAATNDLYAAINGLTRKPITSPLPTTGTNYIVDFSNQVVQITATNNINFLQSTNRTSSGYYAESVWYIQGGTANYTLKFNPNWAKVGTLATNNPALISSNKLTIVAVSARGPGETNVTYAIARQE